MGGGNEGGKGGGEERVQGVKGDRKRYEKERLEG